MLADAQAVRARARLVLDRQTHSKAAAAGKGDGAGGKEPRQRDRDMLSSVSTLRRDDLMGHDGVGRGGARLDMPDMSGISDRMSHHIGEREGGRGLVPGHGLVGPGRVPTEMSR